MPDQKPSPAGADDQPEVVNISHADVEAVTAEMVRMHQSNAQTITSDDVEMNVSAVAVVNSKAITTRQSLIGGVNAGSAQFAGGFVGGLRGTNIDAEGVIGGVVAETVNLQNARVGLTVGKEVRGGQVESLVLLAGHVEGEVHTAVDTRGAILAGLVGGLVTGVVMLVGRYLFRRDEN